MYMRICFDYSVHLKLQKLVDLTPILIMCPHQILFFSIQFFHGLFAVSVLVTSSQSLSISPSGKRHQPSNIIEMQSKKLQNYI